MPKPPKLICADALCGYTARWGLHLVVKSGGSTMAAIGNDPTQVSCGQHLPILLELLQHRSPFVAVTDLRKAAAS